MKVLTVEDDEVIAGVIERNLRARGHICRHAGTGEEALRLLREERPEVLVLDVNLPDSSGWDVLRHLDPESRAAMRVIVVSAAPISQKRLQEFRPQGHLQKPFAITSLLHLLEQDTEEAEVALGAPEGTVF
jgi:two-component system phosphate regulon response regulator PhoB